MSYVEKNLVPGETLLYQTRHHWMVLVGPLLIAVALGLPGLWLTFAAAAKRPELDDYVGRIPGGYQTILIAGVVLVIISSVNLVWGLAKRNATEMAVTNRRVLIKTGMGSRRTLDMILARVESIGVEETVWGRMLGYGSVIVHGTGGTPESFVLISHPQEFRRQVQEQIGAQQQIGTQQIGERHETRQT